MNERTDNPDDDDMSADLYTDNDPRFVKAANDFLTLAHRMTGHGWALVPLVYSGHGVALVPNAKDAER